MSDDEDQADPPDEPGAETPDRDYSKVIPANRYAVFVDQEIWDHFGGEARIRETLRLLVDIAKKKRSS
jgi:hypothetical protein